MGDVDPSHVVKLPGPAVPETRTVNIQVEESDPEVPRVVQIHYFDPGPAEPRVAKTVVFKGPPKEETPEQRDPIGQSAKDGLAAARALIGPQPAPKRKANRIVFEPDATPADAEDRLRKAPTLAPALRPRPGPVPLSAPPDRQAEVANVHAAHAAISPYATLAKAAKASSGSASPELADEELAAVIAVVVQRYGAVLDINTASEVSKLAKQTIRERVCYGQYADCVIRTRPLRFWAHRFVKAVMTP